MNRYIIVLDDGIREIEAEDIPSIVYAIDDIDWCKVIAIKYTVTSFPFYDVGTTGSNIL